MLFKKMSVLQDNFKTKAKVITSEFGSLKMNAPDEEDSSIA